MLDKNQWLGLGVIAGIAYLVDNDYRGGKEYGAESFGAEKKNEMELILADGGWEGSMVLSGDEDAIKYIIKQTAFGEEYRPDIGMPEEWDMGGEEWLDQWFEDNDLETIAQETGWTITRVSSNAVFWGNRKGIIVADETWWGAESFEAEVCPCGCAMKGCVCSSSCKGECLSAESFEAEEWDFGDDREALRKGDEHSDFNNAWRWIFKTKRREWPKWGQKFYDKYKWTLDDPHWNPQLDAESFEAEEMNLEEYEKMSWKTPSDELEDAVENLVAEVKRLRLRLEAHKL